MASLIKLKSRKVDGKIQNKHNHPKQPWPSFNFFIDFLHLCPGGGPAHVFAHPHARQARPAPPLHRDLGLCHGLLNHANFSKLIPCQNKTDVPRTIDTNSGTRPQMPSCAMAWIWCLSQKDLKLSWMCNIVQNSFSFRNKDEKYLFHYFQHLIFQWIATDKISYHVF